jgi:hypothetical protein
MADFTIYRVDAVYRGNKHDYGYQIFESEPDCSQVRSTPWYGAKSDVSGSKTGVRCSGDGCNQNNVSWIDAISSSNSYRQD